MDFVGTIAFVANRCSHTPSKQVSTPSMPWRLPFVGRNATIVPCPSITMRSLKPKTLRVEEYAHPAKSGNRRQVQKRMFSHILNEVESRMKEFVVLAVWKIFPKFHREAEFYTKKAEWLRVCYSWAFLNKNFKNRIFAKSRSGN
jgi:hypothetical protein